MTEQEIVCAVTDLVKAKLGSDVSVRLIGSRATQTAHQGSDYDFLITDTTALPLTTLAELRDAVADLPTLAKIDLVDRATASPEFLHIALQK